MRTRIIVVFCILALPAMGYGQSTLNFPKFFSAAELPDIGFAIVNPGQSTTIVNFKLYGADGSVVASKDQTYTPGSQVARSGSEIFTTGVGSGGWVQATSSATGLQGFWMKFEGTLSLFLDGAESATAYGEQVIPLVAAQTELNVSNPNSAPVSVVVRIYGEAGTEMVASVTRGISANGVLQEDVTSMFALSPFTAAAVRYVKITASGLTPLAAAAVIRGYLTSGTEIGVINGASTASTVTEVNFPHVINGDGGAEYVTEVGVTNLSATSQNVTITFTPFANAGCGISGNPITIQRFLPGNAGLRATAKSLFTLPDCFTNGWVRISGSAALTGFAAYSGGGAVAVVPAQLAPQANLIFPHIANQTGVWTTGIALLNPGSTPATVEVFALRPNGTLIGGADNEPKARFTLGGGTKLSKTLGELIPSADTRPPGEDGGFVFVRSNVALYGIELFYTAGVKVLSNVAAGRLVTGITYAPPPPQMPLSLTSISPVHQARGGQLTLIGTGFNPTAAGNTIQFTSDSGTVDATAQMATTTSLTVDVPQTAMTGPVVIRRGAETTASKVVEVTLTATTQIQSAIPVKAGNTASNADIYVPNPAGPALNASTIGVSQVDQSDCCSLSMSAVEIPRGTSRLLLIGRTAGMTAATALSVSGPGITMTAPQVVDLTNGTPIIYATVTVSSGAPPGPRNIILTNSNFDTTVMSGGVIIR